MAAFTRPLIAALVLANQTLQANETEGLSPIGTIRITAIP